MRGTSVMRKRYPRRSPPTRVSEWTTRLGARALLGSTHTVSRVDPRPARTLQATPPRAPGLLLGIGLGGFVDGILLHQILQWHHMLTSTGSYPMTTVAGLEA